MAKKISNKRKRELEKIERNRQRNVAISKKNGDKIRNLSKNQISEVNDVQMSKKQMEKYVTQTTKISTSQGSNNDRKAGRVPYRLIEISKTPPP